MCVCVCVCVCVGATWKEALDILFLKGIYLEDVYIKHFQKRVNESKSFKYCVCVCCVLNLIDCSELNNRVLS